MMKPCYVHVVSYKWERELIKLVWERDDGLMIGEGTARRSGDHHPKKLASFNQSIKTRITIR